MNMVGIFEALHDRMAARTRTHNDVLLSAARRLAVGESADDSAVDAALAASGQTLDDFRELVALCQRRQEWYGTMDRGPAATITLDKLQATATRERAAFEQVQNAWLSRARELDEQLRTAEHIATAARAAREKLLDPANVWGDLAERIRQAHDAVATTAATVAKNRRERRGAAEREASQQDWAEQKRTLNQHTAGGSADDHERNAERWAKRVAEMDAELPEAERAAAAAETELRRVESLALKV